jgi:hypothetical protein
MPMSIINAVTNNFLPIFFIFEVNANETAILKKIPYYPILSVEISYQCHNRAITAESLSLRMEILVLSGKNANLNRFLWP